MLSNIRFADILHPHSLCPRPSAFPHHDAGCAAPGGQSWRVGSTIGKSAPAAGAMDQFKAEVMPQSRRGPVGHPPPLQRRSGPVERPCRGLVGPRSEDTTPPAARRQANPGPAPGSALEGRTAAAPHAVRQEALALRRVRWSSARQRRHGERPPRHGSGGYPMFQHPPAQGRTHGRTGGGHRGGGGGPSPARPPAPKPA